MQTRHEEIPFSPTHPLGRELFTEHTVFFDIETTGFSPKNTSLYLIGCARRKGNLIHIDQYFAENTEEERAILAAFLKLPDSGDTILTYNGIGFDLPYLKAKCRQYHLPDIFDTFSYIDIFKSVSRLKHIFKLENYRQKSMEQFLHLTRNDRYSGGELIPVYHSYVNSRDQKLLQLLLLHNYEDVLGMMDLIPMLSYSHLFEGKFEAVESAGLDTIRTYDGSSALELTLRLIPDYPLPEQISFRLDDIYLSGGPSSVSLAVRVCEEPLKYFYSNYKDYYYLPEEDTAIHKSVAAYVDKTHREQAKASTCYSRTTGRFLPQYQPGFLTPSFLKKYGDKISYFQYTDSFAEDTDMLAGYARHLLSVLAAGKSCR